MTRESKPEFLNSLIGLFRAKPGGAPQTKPNEGRDFEALRANFDAAIRDLNQKAEQQRRQRAAASKAPDVSRSTVEEREAERARHIADIRQTIRKEIGSMHERLGTGVGGDLEALSASLKEFAAEVDAGKDSHELIPRARARAVQRLQKEAGEFAWTRLEMLRRRENLEWPDPTHHDPWAQPEDIEQSRRRHLAEARESFLEQSLSQTSELLLGIVTVWGSDYPHRGSLLWEETVLDGVAAGIRGDLVKNWLTVARRDEDHIARLAEASIGKELTKLQQVVKAGVTSIEQANQAAASALRALDEVIPDLVWEHVRSQVPGVREK